nr:exosortase C-terminal domain/associated protein EpsI [uncultured Desulfobulbus sp.]
MKLFVLIVLFISSSLFVYLYNAPTTTAKAVPLKNYLKEIPGYKTSSDIELGAEAYSMLKLDDYLFKTYLNKDGPVTLYVGYYYTSSKAYAAHSPLVCYPSHGWQVDKKPKTHVLQIGEHKIIYEEIVTSLGQQQELVLYWHQAREKANVQVYRNKIDMGYNKLMFNDPKHGFVRVSTPFIGTADYEVTKKRVVEFIRTAYPLLLEFVNQPLQM